MLAHLFEVKEKRAPDARITFVSGCCCVNCTRKKDSERNALKSPNMHSLRYFPDDPYYSRLLLLLCAASRMWVRHRSGVIVLPEGGLVFSAGLTKKIVFYSLSRFTNSSGLPYKIVIES